MTAISNPDRQSQHSSFGLLGNRILQPSPEMPERIERLLSGAVACWSTDCVVFGTKVVTDQDFITNAICLDATASVCCSETPIDSTVRADEIARGARKPE